MLFMILLGFALTPASFVAAPATASAQQDEIAVVPPSFAVDEPRKDCPDIGPRIADEQQRSPRARRLDELPAGRLEYAVFREVDGCAIPAVVHENVGRSSDQPEGDDRR